MSAFLGRHFRHCIYHYIKSKFSKKKQLRTIKFKQHALFEVTEGLKILVNVREASAPPVKLDRTLGTTKGRLLVEKKHMQRNRKKSNITLFFLIQHLQQPEVMKHFQVPTTEDNVVCVF